MTHNDSDKLRELQQRIDTAAKQAQEPQGISPKYYALTASRVTVELVAGVLVGAGLGYYADEWFGTKPLFFIVLMFFGVAAAIINIYKLSARQAREEESRRSEIENIKENNG